MPEYRAYKIDSEGHSFEAVGLRRRCGGHGKGKAACYGNDVELWERTRKVAVFKNECQKSGGAITHEVHDGRMISKPAK
jgi:hypothetical protein